MEHSDAEGNVPTSISEEELAGVVRAALRVVGEDYPQGFTTTEFCKAMGMDPRSLSQIRRARGLLALLKRKGYVGSQQVVRLNVHDRPQRIDGWKPIYSEPEARPP